MAINLRYLPSVHYARALFVGLVAAACGGPRPAGMPSPAPGHRYLTVEQQAAQVVNRLAFGPRPGEINAVASAGVDRWIERQLHPESIADSAADAALAKLPVWNASVQTLVQLNPPQDIFVNSLRQERGIATGAQFTQTREDSVTLKTINDRTNVLYGQIIAGRVIRAQVSERQLLEVMTDFWENHFSVFVGKMPTRFTMLEYDRDVIPPRALGKFRDLLGAVAHSPAMLYYLDNWQSVADTAHLTLPEWGQQQRTGHAPQNRKRPGLNENYGRELLELHTLGVDGGYTQQDVIAVARALTGWTVQAPRQGGGFFFRADVHDAEPKVVLGHTLAAGRGIEDGEEVLDILARHPSTAHFIATKLARRFVSDTPGAALVERAAAEFTRTDGDIRAVVRTIVTSPEFFSRAAYRAKVKTPFELVVSARRILGAQPDTSPRSAQRMAQLQQQLWGKLTPNGWPETGDQWINAGSLLDRINFGVQMGTGRGLPGATVEQWPGWNELAKAPLEKQVDGVIERVLGGDASHETRAILLAGQNPILAQGHDPGAVVMTRRPTVPPPPTLRDLLGLALGSPEFQRR